jgi:uncharacterized protein with LGFP repeats/lysophospholipase L1-like esterase
MLGRHRQFRAVMAAGLAALFLIGIGSEPAVACPADPARSDVPQDARDHICGAWDYAASRGFNPGVPLNETHPWGEGYIRDFTAGWYGRGGIMERHGEGWAFIVGWPFWGALLRAGGVSKIGYPDGAHVFGGHLNAGPKANTYMTFTKGVINDSAHGTFASYGAILARWNAMGNVSGPLGLPIGDEADTARVPGRFQQFEGGNLIWNPATGLTWHVYGGILNKYAQLGYSNHPLGLPAGDRQYNPVKGNEYQVFQGGVINQYGGNAYETHGAILDKWNSVGGANGPVGLPISDEAATARVPGRFSRFQGGNIYYNQRINRAVLIYGGILNKYLALGYSNHPLGLPASDRQYNPVRGNEYQVFDGGVINQYGGNAYETHGAMLATWNALGGANGPLGLPTSDEGQTARVSGRYQTFQGGNLYFSPATGKTYHVYGGILNKYRQLGYSAHPLGLPTSNRKPGAKGGDHVYQVFQGGVINQYGGNAYETHGAILARWSRSGGPSGSLGLPTSDEGYTSRSPHGTLGRYSRFQQGIINYNPKINRAIVLFGAIGAKYAQMGYAASYLGLPVTEEHNLVGGGKRQEFEGGYIIWRPGERAKSNRDLSRRPRYVIRAIGDSYTAGFGLQSGPVEAGLRCLDRMPTTVCDYPYGSWAGVLVGKLRKNSLRNRALDYANLAVSGTTSNDWLRANDPRGDIRDSRAFAMRLDSTIRANPDLILMSLGGNDLLGGDSSCLRNVACIEYTIAITRVTMTALLRKMVSQTEARIYVLLYPTMHGDVANAVGRLNRVLKESTRATGPRVKYIPSISFARHDCGDSSGGSWRLEWDAKFDLFGRSCIHPNAAGAVALASGAFKTLQRFGY